jgi:rubrerythrin
MIESTLIDRAQSRLDKLERLYHVGQNNIWDGREVLDSLIAKHGPPRLPPDKKESALKVLSILLWGELAAWAISADLAERIDDVEAKLAATSQAHDEARHFYVLRDYLRALGEPVPHLGGISRRLLLSILDTPSLVHKLIGMQLLTESNALAIFRGLVESRIEPVLADLLPYYEKDEARHVGLGVMYLPRLLSRLSAVETAGVVGFQLRSIAMLMSAGINMHEHFRNLGIDPRRMAEYTIKLQNDVTDEMLADAPTGAGQHRRDAVRGLLNPAQGYGPKILDFIHPRGGIAARPAWHRTALAAWKRAAAAADRALA